MFGKKKKTITLAKNAKCAGCGRKIKEKTDFSVIDGRLYCRKCMKKKEQLDFLTWMAIMDDE